MHEDGLPESSTIVVADPSSSAGADQDLAVPTPSASCSKLPKGSSPDRYVSQVTDSTGSSTSVSRPHYTPSLVDSVNTSASFPPPTPVESSRKRHRSHYSEDDNVLLQEEWLQPHGPSVEDWLESPSRRRRSDPHPGYSPETYSELRRHSAPRYDTPGDYASSSHHHHHRRLSSGTDFSGESQQRECSSASNRSDRSSYYYRQVPSSMPPPPPSSSQSYRHGYSTGQQANFREFSSSAVYHDVYPHHQRHHGATSQWKKQHRPETIAAARQASTASHGSLFGEGGNSGGLNEFDLFNGELLDDMNNEMYPNLGASSSASPR